jgi:hypothetical protein
MATTPTPTSARRTTPAPAAIRVLWDRPLPGVTLTPLRLPMLDLI